MFERIKTALVLVVVVLLCMFATSYALPMLVLLMLAAIVGTQEWLRLMPPLEYPARFILGAPLVVLLSLCWSGIWPALWAFAVLFWLLGVYWVRQYPAKTGWATAPVLSGVGVLLLAAGTTAIFGLWQLSPWLLMYLFGLVWGADSGAYFAGRKFGKRKLAPNVSPAKTFEGLAGGVLLTAVYAVLVGLFLLKLPAWGLLGFLLLSVVTVAASVYGDLLESMLKRQAGVKDSGTLLPGHGGVLDRIDSLLAAAPLFAFGYWWLGGF